VFLHVPYSYAVRLSDFSCWKHLETNSPYSLQREAKEMEKLLEEKDITFINPIDELIANNQETRMYYFLDIHFTPAWNRVLSDKSTPIINEIILGSLS